MEEEEEEGVHSMDGKEQTKTLMFENVSDVFFLLKLFHNKTPILIQHKIQFCQPGFKALLFVCPAVSVCTVVSLERASLE